MNTLWNNGVLYEVSFNRNESTVTVLNTKTMKESTITTDLKNIQYKDDVRDLIDNNNI